MLDAFGQGVASGDPLCPAAPKKCRYLPLVALTFGDRVVLLDTPHNREVGQVGATGEVVGISYEHEDDGPHVAYGVMLDGVDRANHVYPDGLRREDG